MKKRHVVYNTGESPVIVDLDTEKDILLGTCGRDKFYYHQYTKTDLTNEIYVDNVFYRCSGIDSFFVSNEWRMLEDLVNHDVKLTNSGSFLISNSEEDQNPS